MSKSESCGASCHASAHQARRHILWMVLIINLSMFFVEIIYSFFANSSSLFADSLDMLGDSFAYAISIFVIGRGARAMARATMIKGVSMLALGLSVAGAAFYRFFVAAEPDGSTISIIGAAAMAANVICLLLLTSFKDDDINMKSVWLCSRNDLIANSLVIAAGIGVIYTQSRWPDLIAGMIITYVVLRSSIQVIRSARNYHGE